MNENAGQFRSAAVGGFHRQDVLNYLEKLNQTHQEEKETLCQPLEAEITRLREQVRIQALDLIQTREEVTALRETVARLEPDAASWNRIKDTAGDIEVAAHERAQITIQEAQVKSAEIRAESLRQVMEIQQRFDQLQKDLKSALCTAEQELNTARASFDQAEKDIDGAQKALANLLEESCVQI